MFAFRKIITISLSTFLVLFVHIALLGQEGSISEIDSLTIDEYHHLQFHVPQWEYVPDFDYYEIEDKLSCIETDIPLHYNEYVKGFIDYFTIKNRDYIKEIVQKRDLYFPIFEYYLAKYNLPDELKYLAIVESGLNPKAVSRAGAVGMWQFMPRTARMEFGLTEDWYIDEKMDIFKSTDAACRYLAALYGIFNDWELALAAYNSGPGNVRKAIRLSGYKKTFWEVYPYLKRETRSYVPQFVAIIYTLHYLEDHHFFDIPNHQRISLDTVWVSDFLLLTDIASFTGISLQDIEHWNPSVRKGAIPAYVNNFPLYVPATQAAYLTNLLPEILSASAQHREEFEKMARNTPGSVYGREKIVHYVRSGDVLGKIANQYGVRISDIQAWNNLHGTTIYVGQKLNVWVLPTFASTQTGQNTAQKSLAVITQKSADGEILYVVQSGDTLWDISRKFEGLTIDEIMKMNDLKSNQIKPGMQLKLSVK